MKCLVIVLAIAAAVALAAEKSNYDSAWVVLIGGKFGWDNYATEAWTYKLYHVLHDMGVPDDRIVTFFADDVAYADGNPFPGEVYAKHYVEGGHNENVYEGLLKDYTGTCASPDNLVKVLTGVTPTCGSGKVVKSTAGDNVFVFYVGHGSTSGGVMMPSTDWLWSTSIEKIVNSISFHKFMLFMEAGYSSRIIPSSFQKNPPAGVYFVASRDISTDCTEASDYDHFIRNYVSRYDIGNFTEYIEKHGFDFTIETLFTVGGQEHFARCQYGDSLVKNMTFSDFMWNTRASHTHNHHLPPLNIPGYPICKYQSCDDSCDCYAICKIRGYPKERCTSLCCNTDEYCL